MNVNHKNLMTPQNVNFQRFFRYFLGLAFGSSLIACGTVSYPPIIKEPNPVVQPQLVLPDFDRSAVPAPLPKPTADNKTKIVVQEKKTTNMQSEPIPDPKPVPNVSRPPVVQPKKQSSVVLDPVLALQTVKNLLPTKINNREEWAVDLRDVMLALKLRPSPENFCAAIAVIEQESTFNADPVVPNLPAIVRQEIKSRQERFLIPDFLINAGLAMQSPNGKTYQQRIDSLRTESQLSILFEDMISNLPVGKQLLENANPVRTGGPMQVSVAFAEGFDRQRPYPFLRSGQSVRSLVFSRKGGLYFGVANLLAYPATYSSPIFRFADFNAGHYSSRNAAFQKALSLISGRTIDYDGDLLIYDKNQNPTDVPSEVQKLIWSLSYQLGLSQSQINAQLRQEKQHGFSQTALYKKVFELADQKYGKQVPRELIPQINLKSPKIKRKLTTEWFANRVHDRYLTCMSRNKP